MICFKCKTEEGKMYFISKSKTKTFYMCRKCNTYRHQRYRETNKGKQNTYKAAKKYTSQNKEKSSAWQAVRYVRKNKNFPKPSNCTDCGRKNKLDAHHDDYSKPLEVRWLCRLCHKKAHKK